MQNRAYETDDEATIEETEPLLPRSTEQKEKKSENIGQGLSVFWSALCIVDQFGVLPIITMSRPVVDCGWLGPPLAICVFALQIYTAVLLCRCWTMARRISMKIKQENRRPYSALAEMCYGPFSGRLTSILLDLAVFAGGVPNLILASQNMQLLGRKAVTFNWDISHCYWLPIIGLLLIPATWLGSPKDMKWIAASSSGMVLVSAACLWVSVISDNIGQSNTANTITGPSWESVAIAYGNLAFQFDVHLMILTLQVDMSDQMKVGKAIFAGYSATGSLFLLTCLICFLHYGGSLQYNLLRNPPASLQLDAGVLLATFQACLSTVIGLTPLFQGLEDRMGISRDFGWKRCLLRGILTSTAIVLGEAVPRLDLVMSLIGGSLTGPLVFILPPLLYARLRSMEPQPPILITPEGTFFIDNRDRPELRIGNPEGLWKRVRGNFTRMLSLEDYPRIGPMSAWEKLKMTVVVAAGVIAAFLSSYFSIREFLTSDLRPPCIFNVTAASNFVNG